MLEKKFILHQTGIVTNVTPSPELGRILARREVTEIVKEFGSNVIRMGLSINIVPPLKDDDLPKLGKALEDLARSLDDSDPQPFHRIK